MCKPKTGCLKSRVLLENHRKSDSVNPNQPVSINVALIHLVYPIDHALDRPTVEVISKDVQADLAARTIVR